jgi:hypothetical protein
VGLTILMGLLSIALIIVLYTITGGWRQYGGFMGIFRWIRSGALSDPTLPSKRSASATGTMDEEVAAILEDLYADLKGDVEQLRVHLEARLSRLESMVGETAGQEAWSYMPRKRPVRDGEADVATNDTGVGNGENGDGAGGSIPPSAEVTERRHQVAQESRANRHNSRESEEEFFSERYFDILDLLSQGYTSLQVSRQLGVTEAAVHKVQHIMSSPVLSVSEPN